MQVFTFLNIFKLKTESLINISKGTYIIWYLSQQIKLKEPVFLLLNKLK